jgi:hypothetical protein
MSATDRRVVDGCVFDRASGILVPVRTGPAERRVDYDIREWLDACLRLSVDKIVVPKVIAALRRPKVTEERAVDRFMAVTAAIEDAWRNQRLPDGELPGIEDRALVAARVAIERLK